MSDSEDSVVPDTQDQLHIPSDGNMEAGIIKKVELINFMCHAHLTFDFASNVNFLVGNNGSGKSAVLVALVTCLGASAKFSNRSSRVGDLVKNGAHAATIKITLRNEGPEAFRPEVYGKTIVVERRIQKEGGGGYTIRDEQGRKQSSTRDELNDILEQFNIQVDNPCNVLMQDASKLFLSGNKPEKKYELFLKATQLEQMYEDLEATGNNIKLGEIALTTKEESLPAMEERMKELETKVQAMQMLESDRKRARQMRAMLAWAHVKLQEGELAEAEESVLKIEAQITKLQDARQGKEEKLAAMRADENQLMQQLNEMRGGARELREEEHKVATEMRSVTAGAARFDADVDTRKAELTRLKGRKDQAKKHIRDLQAKARGADQEAVYMRKQKEAEKKRRECEKLSAELADCGQRRPEVEEELSTVEENLRSLESQSKRLQEEVQKLSATEKRLSTAAKDRTAVFGTDAPRVIDLLRRNKNLFSHPPIGPIGLHVTLVEEKWSQIVEAEIGKTLDKFIVSSADDLRAFQQLMKRSNIQSPQLIVSSFTSTPYKIGVDNLPPSQFKTLLSTIKISDPTCFNVIIDDIGPEGFILFDTFDEAKKVMYPSSPPNCRQGYALDTHSTLRAVNGSEITTGVKVTNAPRLQADVSAALESVKRELSEKSPQLQPLLQEAQRLKSRHTQLHREVKVVTEKLSVNPGLIDRLNAEIEELEKPPEVPPDMAEEVNAQEAVLLDLDQRMAVVQKDIDGVLEEKKAYLKGVEPLEARRQETAARVQELQQMIEKAAHDLDGITNALQREQLRIPQFDQALEKLNASLSVEGKKCQDLRALVEEFVTKAQSLAPRPPEEMLVVDTPDVIERKIVNLERLIEEKQKDGGLSQTTISEYKEAKAHIDELKQAIIDSRAQLTQAHEMLKVRGRKWVNFRKAISNRARALFVSYLSYRNFEGQLKFDHKEKALNIEVNPTRATGGGTRDTTTLSGGERSFSTVALLLALWDMMESPFRAMDEFDVFMDAVNRRLSMEMLLEAAQEKRHRQYIFLTPQQLQGVHLSEFIKVIRMRPAERNQRTITGMLNGNEDGAYEEEED